jgi:1-acyl-sn-glycerol-3-phosphate acyltransferase
VIPIAGAKENPEVLEAAFARIAQELAEGELVCIFPEGRLTRDGKLSPFRRGIERIIAASPVPVVPMALSGLWGSWFSRSGKVPERRRFGHLWQPITLTVGEPMRPEVVSVERVEAAIVSLLEVAGTGAGSTGAAEVG